MNLFYTLHTVCVRIYILIHPCEVTNDSGMGETVTEAKPRLSGHLPRYGLLLSFFDLQNHLQSRKVNCVDNYLKYYNMQLLMNLQLL